MIPGEKTILKIVVHYTKFLIHFPLKHLSLQKLTFKLIMHNVDTPKSGIQSWIPSSHSQNLYDENTS